MEARIEVLTWGNSIKFEKWRQNDFCHLGEYVVLQSYVHCTLYISCSC